VKNLKKLLTIFFLFDNLLEVSFKKKTFEKDLSIKIKKGVDFSI
jgi:hypothetical protein